MHELRQVTKSEILITNIILTAELQQGNPIDYEDLNTDVIVNFDNGDRYVATFFSHKALNNTIEADIQSGDFYSKQYYRILNLVLVKDFNNGDVRSVIDSMIAEGDFQLIFKKI